MHDNPATDGRAGSAAIDAAAELHHDWITGLVLALITHAGEQIAAQFVFQLFRRQHLACFLPGLEKLGLQALPPRGGCSQIPLFFEPTRRRQSGIPGRTCSQSLDSLPTTALDLAWHSHLRNSEYR